MCWFFTLFKAQYQSPSVFSARGQQRVVISLRLNHSIRVTGSQGWGFFNVCQKLQFQSVDTEVKTTHQHGQPSNTLNTITTTPPLLPRKRISMITNKHTTQHHNNSIMLPSKHCPKTVAMDWLLEVQTHRQSSTKTQHTLHPLTVLHQNTTYSIPTYSLPPKRTLHPLTVLHQNTTYPTPTYSPPPKHNVPNTHLHTQAFCLSFSHIFWKPGKMWKKM